MTTSYKVKHTQIALFLLFDKCREEHQDVKLIMTKARNTPESAVGNSNNF